MKAFPILRSHTKSLLVLGWLLVLTGCFPRQPLHLSLLFEESNGLKASQPVMYRGDRIGHVLQIYRGATGTVTVDVEILPEYRDSMYQEMDFRIVEDLSTGSAVSVEDREGGRTSVDDGDIIDTRPGWADRLSLKAQELSESAGKALQALGATASGVIETLGKSPEAQAFKDSLLEFGQDLTKIAQSRYGHFVRDELPELERKARAYRDKLEREGRTEEAEIFWKWFTRWAEAVQKRYPSEEEKVKAEKEPG